MSIIKFKQDWDTFYKMAKCKKLVIFGAGYRAAGFINSNPNLHIEYICESKINDLKYLMNIPVVSPAYLQKENLEDIVILITSADNKSVIELCGLSFEKNNLFIMDALNSEGEYAVYFHDHYDELLETVELLSDDLSKNILLKIANDKQLGISDYNSIFTPNEYFLHKMYEHYTCNDEVIIDAGGYVGDTLVKFIDFFGSTIKRIYSFEPAPALAEKLQAVADSYPQYDIIIKPYGLFNINGHTEFVFQKNAWAGSHLKERMMLDNEDKYDNEALIVEVRTLDSVIPENEKVSFIKMDIEGAECGAILGAKNIIQKYKPRLAIAIYHSAHDYIEIPKLIKEIVPEYQLYVRHHTTNGADTVLYAFI